MIVFLGVKETGDKEIRQMCWSTTLHALLLYFTTFTTFPFIFIWFLVSG